MAWPLLCSLASLALALRSRLPASPRMAFRPLVVPASAFADELAYRTVTASTFAGAPLASHDTVTRGKVLTGYARRCDADEHPGAVIEDAVAGEDVNGRRQAQTQAAYDWQRDGRRVACKGAQLTWDDSRQRWMLQFSAVKPDACDELLLAAYTPEGVHLFRHDGRAGVGTSGVSTAATGKEIQFLGPRNEPDWRVALGEILGKVEDKGCRPLAFVPWDEAEASSQSAA